MGPPAAAPCVSCPYRCDVPSGIWDASEYEKLARYDVPMALQPIGLFQCHQEDAASSLRRMCAGWAGCHGEELLALRFAHLISRTINDDTYRAAVEYRSPVPLFESGAAAAQHGMADLTQPGARARRRIHKIISRRTDLLLPDEPADGTSVFREALQLHAKASARDGDCIETARRVTEELVRRGMEARTKTVKGWLDPSGKYLAFMHQVTVCDETVLDGTARQFDNNLPTAWIAPVTRYLDHLALVTGVDHVTLTS